MTSYRLDILNMHNISQGMSPWWPLLGLLPWHPFNVYSYLVCLRVMSWTHNLDITRRLALVVITGTITLVPYQCLQLPYLFEGHTHLHKMRSCLLNILDTHDLLQSMSPFWTLLGLLHWFPKLLTATLFVLRAVSIFIKWKAAYWIFWTYISSYKACHPGGHYWDCYTGTLSMFTATLFVWGSYPSS